MNAVSPSSEGENERLLGGYPHWFRGFPRYFRGNPPRFREYIRYYRGSEHANAANLCSFLHRNVGMEQTHVQNLIRNVQNLQTDVHLRFVT